MAKDFFGRLEETISTTGKAAAQKAKEVADSAKRHNDLRVAKRDLNDLYRQVGEKYFEEHMDYPQAECSISSRNLEEILRFSNRRLKAKKMNSRMAKTSKNNETNKNSRESL